VRASRLWSYLLILRGVAPNPKPAGSPPAFGRLPGWRRLHSDRLTHAHITEGSDGHVRQLADHHLKLSAAAAAAILATTCEVIAST
jgi:hypothetical protein